MLNINVITVGKLKESYLRDACAEYEKRLGAYSTIKVIELAESRLPDSPSQKEIANALENEADMILKKITSECSHSHVHRGQDDVLRGLFAQVGGLCAGGQKHCEPDNRQLIRAFGQGEECGAPETFNVAHDISSSAGKGDAAGTALPCYEHFGEWKIS